MGDLFAHRLDCSGDLQRYFLKGVVMFLGWLTQLTSFLSSLFKASSDFSGSFAKFLLNHVFLLVLPGIGIIKLVYDFARSCIDRVVLSLSGFQAFDSGEAALPAVISFVNFFFPIDAVFLSVTLLFTFFLTCQLIATIRGIKQTILF